MRFLMELRDTQRRGGGIVSRHSRWAVLVLAVVIGGSARAQEAGGSSALKGAEDNWKNSTTRKELVLHACKTKDFFPGSHLFLEPGRSEFPGYSKKASGKVPADQPLSVGTFQQAGGGALTIQKGDVFLVHGASASSKRVIVLVYVGEDHFPDDTGKKYSFFIYPLATRLERNTFPPRMHEELHEALLGKKPPAKPKSKPKQDKRFLPSEDTAHGGVRWRRKSAGKLPLLQTVFNAGGADLYRPGGTFVFLKEAPRMPCHRQQWPTKDQLDKNIPAGGTCFWAAYSDVLAYETRKSHPISRETVLGYESAFVKKYLQEMSPQEDKELQQTFLASTFIKSLPPEQQKQRIQHKQQWDFWLNLDKNLGIARSKLKIQFLNVPDHNAFVAAVEKALQQDKPVLVNTVYHTMDFALPATADTKFPEEPYKVAVRTVKHGQQRQAGHFLVIVGMQRKEKGGAILYFQNGHFAGDPGEYIDAELTVNHVRKIDSKVFWDKSVRRANNSPLFSESGVMISPVMVVGK